MSAAGFELSRALICSGTLGGSDSAGPDRPDHAEAVLRGLVPVAMLCNSASVTALW